MEEDTWVVAFKFPSMEEAKSVWERARDILFANECDASVYRSLIGGEAHVVIAGWDTVPIELRSQFSVACEDGEQAEIPEHVREYLIHRRNAEAIPGAFWERRAKNL